MWNRILKILIVILSLLLVGGVGYNLYLRSQGNNPDYDLEISFTTFDPNNQEALETTSPSPTPTPTPEETVDPEPVVTDNTSVTVVTPEPTPEEIAPVLAEDADGYTITDEMIRLSSPAYLIDSPSPEGQSLHHYNAGEEVHIIGFNHNEQYWKAELDGQEGYVNKKYLDLSVEADANVNQPAEEPTETYEEVPSEEPTDSTWNGSVLTASLGVNYGPSGKETYYNLPMDGVIGIMRSAGIYGDYWVREDGAKMYGDYVMVAADLNKYPRGSLVETSLGTGIVADTGTFTTTTDVVLDIATAW